MKTDSHSDDKKEIVIIGGGFAGINLAKRLLKNEDRSVSKKDEGRGLAKELLNTMVAYARENNLQVIALFPYVVAPFKRYLDGYKDVWKTGKEQGPE